MRLKPISIIEKEKPTINKVVVGLYQPRLVESMFKQDKTTMLSHLREDNNLVEKKIEEIIEFAIDSGVNILCFPELYMTQKIAENIKVGKKNIIIIAGSYYQNRKCICPIITPNGCYLTEKVKASPYERSPMDNTGLTEGDSIAVIESNFGTFGILICSDFLEETIRNLIYNYEKELDFLFIISCNSNSRRFHEMMSTDCENSKKGLYICYCNSIASLGGYEADGKTAIFGVMHSMYLNHLKTAGLKPNDGVLYKVCEIEEEDIIIAEFDLGNKKVIIPMGHNTMPNIKIIHPSRSQVRILDNGIFFEIQSNEIKQEFKNLIGPDPIFERIWSYILKQTTKEPAHIYSIDQLESYVISGIKSLLNVTFEGILKKHRNSAVTKVTGWEGIYVHDENFKPTLEESSKREFVQACKILAKEFADVPSKFNVLSLAIFNNSELNYMLITGRNTNKANIDIKELSITKKENNLFKYSGHSLSSEAPINWQIHKKTNAEIIVHLNTKEIFDLSCNLLQESCFGKILAKHPFITYEENKILIYEDTAKTNIKVCIPIVDKAIDVDVIELASSISSVFTSDYFKTIVIGKKHASWFIVDKVDKIIEKSQEFNKEIETLIQDYRHLAKNQFICTNCHSRIKAQIEGIKGQVKCSKCNHPIELNDR